MKPGASLSIALALAALALGGCSGEQYGDLRQFVKEQENLPRGRIPPVPEVKPYEPFAYDAYDLTDPFKPRSIQPPKGAGGNKGPDLARPKEPLEAFPLENLRMVGTLQQKKATFALIRTPDNNLFRVRSGNYLGQNFGRIEDVSESGVKLKELVQDAAGDWTERISTLQLAEDGSPAGGKQ
jgi:type IV pilus assembly protein PilP